MVAMMVRVALATLILCIVSRPVLFLLHGALESYWFAKTYQMPNSWKLGHRLLGYAALWGAGATAAMALVWMPIW